MKTENDFNAHLTKEIRKLGTEYKAIKMCDRFKIGVSDWLVFHKGLSVALEAKFARKLPKRGKLLTHPVTGPQISFMKSLALAGVPGKIIIATGFDSLLRLIPIEQLPEDGNFTLEQFQKLTETNSCKMSDISILMGMLFNAGT